MPSFQLPLIIFTAKIVFFIYPITFMSWATHYIAKLQGGENVSFRPRGNSMQPRIQSGQLCTVEVIKDFSTLQVHDVVLCKVKGQHYLHLISAIDKERFQISNNKGYVNGWIHQHAVYGKLTKVEK